MDRQNTPGGTSDKRGIFRGVIPGKEIHYSPVAGYKLE